MFHQWKVSLLMLVAALSAVGCTTTQKYMAGGATVGALVGGIWANEAAGVSSLNTAQGALIGGAAGGVIGALAGDAMGGNSHSGLAAERDKYAAEVARLQKENDELRKALADCRNQPVPVAAPPAQSKTEYLSLTLLSDVLFEPGKSVLLPAGTKELDRVADDLKAKYSGQKIMIEGHTDDTPIKASGWKDNWELGSARSLAVLRYLIGKGVAPARLAASTYAFYQPVAPNDTVDGRRQNRRSVIAIYSDIKREQAPKP